MDSPETKQQELKCPACGTANLMGADRCEECLHSLMTVDLPHPVAGETIQKVMMTAPIRDLVTGKDLLVCRGTDSIKKVIQIMQKEKKSCILIYQEKKLMGILSNRDLLKKVVGKFEDLSKVKAEEVMTPNPEFVKPEDPIAFVVNKMAMGGFRHVPVLSADGKPFSIVSIRDVLRYLEKRD